MTPLTIGKLAVRVRSRSTPFAATSVRDRRRRKAQGLGFSLTEIAQLLHFGVDQSATKADVLGLTAQKIEAHRVHIRELEDLQHTLVQAAEQCAGDTSPASDCLILEFLYPDEADVTTAMQS
jgi:hypothetical protein